jgi:hypothetical protein
MGLQYFNSLCFDTHAPAYTKRNSQTTQIVIGKKASVLFPHHNFRRSYLHLDTHYLRCIALALTDRQCLRWVLAANLANIRVLIFFPNIQNRTSVNQRTN